MWNSSGLMHVWSSFHQLEMLITTLCSRRLLSFATCIICSSFFHISIISNIKHHKFFPQPPYEIQPPNLKHQVLDKPFSKPSSSTMLLNLSHYVTDCRVVPFLDFQYSESWDFWRESGKLRHPFDPKLWCSWFLYLPQQLLILSFRFWLEKAVLCYAVQLLASFTPSNQADQKNYVIRLSYVMSSFAVRFCRSKLRWFSFIFRSKWAVVQLIL